jgi:hypothetical protein
MLTRRDFLANLAAAGALAALPLPAELCGEMRFAAHPVVSIHMDQPYVDWTGRALPYLPPAGVRAGAPIAHLTEAEFRSRFVYL